MSTAEERRTLKQWSKNPCMKIGFERFIWGTFCPWQSKEWMLPWSRLDAISFLHDGESERVELLFPNHHGVIVGENLRKVIEEIPTLQVEYLRDMPASHRASLNPGEPFISQLEVRVPNERKDRPVQGHLF